MEWKEQETDIILLAYAQAISVHDDDTTMRIKMKKSRRKGKKTTKPKRRRRNFCNKNKS